jgi:teichoic acid glycerol-phosphate primase
MQSSRKMDSITSSVAIITGPSTHLDHLGVLSSILKIPLIVTEEKNFQCAQQFYPDLNVALKNFDELSVQYLASNYDVIFETGKFFAVELKPLFELLFRKKMRFVFCPHGNSDKGHSLQSHVDQDICLVYGKHLYDLLNRNGAIEKIQQITRTGNYRYPYYRRHQQFFDSLAEKWVFSKFQNDKPIILYAPTWSDRENPSSFFSAINRLLKELCGSYNLLIKLHPFLFEDHIAHVLQIMAQYEEHPSALFLTDFPPIYPLLSRCALYLGDYSSIGYDFLAFDKPLYFLNPKKDSISSPLHACGLEIPMDKRVELNVFLSRTLEDSARNYSAQRKKTYRYAFGEELSAEMLRNKIFNCTNTSI